jgi:hypothetical protein
MKFRKPIQSTVAVIALLISSLCFAQASITEGGVSGQFYNAGRDGEGLFVEIVDTSNGGQQISVAWFTYDLDGFQMWLVGNIVLEGDPTTVTIPVVVTNGPKFGQDYDMADLNRVSWGTLTLTFPDCNSAVLSYASSAPGFGSGAINLTRLTNLTQVRCTDVPPPVAGLTPGRWIGSGVCLFVAQDGRSLTSENSTCDSGRSVDTDIENLVDDQGGSCDVEVETRATIAIIDGSFAYSQGGESIVGTFTSGTSATGIAQEVENTTCTGPWTVSPDP